MNRKFGHALGVTAAGVVLGLAASLAGTAGSAGASGSARSATPSWRTFGGRLYGAAATSRSNAWAVGLDPGGSLILHWDGAHWTKAYGSEGFFEGVAALSAGNAWAVGGTSWFGAQTMIVHWNGTSWSRVTSPSPSPGGTLNGVAVFSHCNAWAVGSIGGGPGDGTSSATKPLIEHWNGRSWQQVPTPALPAGTGGGLGSVTVTSRDNAWAVGWTGTAPNVRNASPLIEHWNGASWQIVAPPAGWVAGTVLTAVSARSADDVWAVGTWQLYGADDTYILHWTGSSWQRVTSPTPSPGAVLDGVTALPGGDAWAVGTTNHANVCDPKCETVIEHWNGTSWQSAPSPNPHSSYLNVLFSVAIVGGRPAWAVGTTDYARTLVLHWNGTAWKA